MTFLRLLPVIFSDILLAAHFLRFYGLVPAAVVLLLLFSLLIRSIWVLRSWQGILMVAVLIWIKASINLVHARIALDLPWIRLSIIMIGVIAFTIFSGFWLENKKIRKYFNKNS